MLALSVLAHTLCAERLLSGVVRGHAGPTAAKYGSSDSILQEHKVGAVLQQFVVLLLKGTMRCLNAFVVTAQFLMVFLLVCALLR